MAKIVFFEHPFIPDKWISIHAIVSLVKVEEIPGPDYTKTRFDVSLLDGSTFQVSSIGPGDGILRFIKFRNFEGFE